MQQCDNTRFHYYELKGVIEQGQFYLDMQTQIAVLIDGNTKPPTLLEAQKFTLGELDLLVVLLDNYPYYASHYDLYAAFHRMTSQRARKMLDAAEDAGNWDNIMRGVRNVLSRTRIKLRFFGIETKGLLETGYLLIPVKKR